MQTMELKEAKVAAQRSGQMAGALWVVLVRIFSHVRHNLRRSQAQDIQRPIAKEALKESLDTADPVLIVLSE